MTKPIMNIRTHTYNMKQHKLDAIEVHKCNLMHCNGQWLYNDSSKGRMSCKSFAFVPPISCYLTYQKVVQSKLPQNCHTLSNNSSSSWLHTITVSNNSSSS